MEEQVAQAFCLPVEEVRRWPQGCVATLAKVIEQKGWLA